MRLVVALAPRQNLRTKDSKSSAYAMAALGEKADEEN
jgi:hypothetical protein